ncbi:MAG: GNAT family N-acetyltransferase [Rhodospirillaceae bacterium]|jgi:ribosomal protein S18 acetylase RimI-like enzyme|nr:GNAT family N-acetyltransferase [Rhodospirillaceae bacterium]MBT4046582.1 GNAT family N-acetyltransferase [Rhodospirillaceae bacterium]MBT4690856.1 GNAT family N-acetyltransferase [Rhodospirillaceae bacterium]MBT5081563.1 GNAT family N-acetyltransferase [Rhodospirillaceae bacterium]MBT5527005.1 GNAT family N-acetyltransferase [Rhodospirillaceae bacterium]
MDCIIGPANDAPSLAIAAAQLIWDSSPQFLGYIYADNRARGFKDLQHQWLQRGGLLSHRHGMLATSQPKPTNEYEILGLSLSMPGSGMIAQSEVTGGILSSLATDRILPKFKKRLKAMDYHHPPVPEGAYYLQNIAVSTEFRGQAIGHRLFQDVLNRAGTAAYTALHLDVISNNPAVAFYRRQGMEILSETNLPALWTKDVQPTRYRMVMDIP